MFLLMEYEVALSGRFRSFNFASILFHDESMVVWHQLEIQNFAGKCVVMNVRGTKNPIPRDRIKKGFLDFLPAPINN